MQKGIQGSEACEIPENPPYFNKQIIFCKHLRKRS